MAEQMKKFSSSDFNPDKYVKEVSQVCVGGLELQRHKAKIQAIAEETSQALKKNVYKNYMQFIETAREISHLEGEMYQLSHLLSEQRALLASMTSPPPQLEQVQVKDQIDKRLPNISELVDGCINLQEVEGRELLHDGDLVELDSTENIALHRCHAFLFSDIIMITTWISDRRGPAKYKYQCKYDLATLAVVNVRDFGSVKHAFKLLVFPDTRLFQCPNHQAREEWLSKFEEGKKACLNSEQAKKCNKDDPKTPPIRTDSVDSGSNPFGYFDDDGESVNEIPEWFLDAPDDLDVFIAQRLFEEAYSLIQKATEFIKESENKESLLEIQSKIESRTQLLSDTLLGEMSVSNEKSLQGGLRATRRSIKLLNQLGKSSQACELYLKVCSNVLKAQTRRVKKEGTTLSYVKRISQVFFSSLAGITGEFQYRAFPNSPSCSSSFVVWASMEVSHFMGHFVKQVFVPQASINMLAESVGIVRNESRQMGELGFDLEYQLNGHLITPVTKALTETREKLIEAIRKRATEDTWNPVRPPKIIPESLKPYIADGGWLELTANTQSFTKLFTSLLDDCLAICWPDLEYATGKVLYEVFEAQMKHIAASYENSKFLEQRPLIIKNTKYLLVDFLGNCKSKYLKKLHHIARPFEKITKLYIHLSKDHHPHTSAHILGYV
ncbi:exocyst complex component 8 [Cimex lectularius]|uniref:Exocyst complex component 8 n=1 Tax=Cimex lectularius TaxID=79782 RepID=A0A8I6RGV2_CIMLE|nr:exocyst complex component 8 [Cimex lectularius]